MASSIDEGPYLPPELEREIFEFSAQTDTQTALILLRVARRVYGWILPIIYHTLVLEVPKIVPCRTIKFLDAHRRKIRRGSSERSKHFDLIRRATCCTDSTGRWETTKTSAVVFRLSLCPNLTSLALVTEQSDYLTDQPHGNPSLLYRHSVKELYLPTGGNLFRSSASLLPHKSDLGPDLFLIPIVEPVNVKKPLQYPLLTSLTHLTCSSWELHKIQGFDMSRFTSLTHLRIETVRLLELDYTLTVHFPITLTSFVHSSKCRVCVLRLRYYSTQAEIIGMMMEEWDLQLPNVLLIPQTQHHADCSGWLTNPSGFEVMKTLPERFWEIGGSEGLWDRVDSFWKWAERAVDEQKQTGMFL